MSYTSTEPPAKTYSKCRTAETRALSCAGSNEREETARRSAAAGEQTQSAARHNATTSNLTTSPRPLKRDPDKLHRANRRSARATRASRSSRVGIEYFPGA